MPGGFGVGPCRFCEKMVTSCGFGEWNHLRMHYRQVFCREPLACYSVNDLAGLLLRWRREELDKVRATGVY